jgi:TATA-box binding protein (TBP) (component of TFIID and TFIIIB)
VEDAEYSCWLFVDKINADMYEDVQVLNFKVQNIVCSFSMGFSLNIDLFYEDQKCGTLGHSHYEPSLFRGIAWRVKGGIVFVVFSSGRVVLTGAKDWPQALKAYDEAVCVLTRYKIGKEYRPFNPSSKRTRAVDIRFASDKTN